MEAHTPSRSAALDIIRASRSRLDQLIAPLTDDDVGTPATLGGGSWSIKDLIGHLTSWEARALRWLESSDAMDQRSYPSTDEFNAAEVQRRADWSLRSVRAEAAAIHQRLIDSIDRFDDDAWLAVVPVPGREPVTRGAVVGRILAGDEHGLFAHDLAHLNDVEAYVRSRTSTDPTDRPPVA